MAKFYGIEQLSDLLQLNGKKWWIIDQAGGTAIPQ